MPEVVLKVRLADTGGMYWEREVELLEATPDVDENFLEPLLEGGVL